AYRADTLDRLWEMRTDASAGTFDCGRVLCVDTPDTGVDGRDPRTGRRLWHGEGWDWARPLGDGRLLAQSHENGRSGLVDATTGRVVVDLGPANNVLEPETGRILVVGTTRTEPYGSKITELEDSGEVIVRGILGPVSDQGCQALGRRLACAVAGGRLTVRDVG
ncbi:MAG TPA: hypothetical protein VFR35_05520, partial [Actinoplanes sp.]|nr:hypothetical protein [Actinoplanes sp.]